MTLPVSGAISINAINVELGVAGTTTASLGQASFRTLAGVASGPISMSNFYGKSNRAVISYTFSASTANASLNISAIGGYVAGKSDITVTINSGVYLYATTTGNYGLTLTGGTTGDTLTIVNKGFIMGRGGDGENRAPANVTSASLPNGNPGGPALNLNTGINATINNTNSSAYIGGGGGGGGGILFTPKAGKSIYGAGGGAGGGTGGYGYDAINGTSNGGAGGSIGASGTNGATTVANSPGGGGGGRVFPSTSTTRNANGSTYQAGLGGSGGGTGIVGASSGTNSVGGGPTQAGSATSVSLSYAGGGGGGWGASGGNPAGGSINTYYGSGAAGGKAVNLNGRSVTWVSGNTSRVYGAVS